MGGNWKPFGRSVVDDQQAEVVQVVQVVQVVHVVEVVEVSKRLLVDQSMVVDDQQAQVELKD